MIFDESDVRAVIHLLGDVAALEGTSQHRKRMLLDGLVKLVDADMWMWSLSPELDPHKNPVYTCCLSGGFEEDQFSKFLVALEHPDMGRLTAPFVEEVQSSKRQLTRLPSEFDPENELMKSEAFDYWVKAEVGPALLSFRPIENERFSVVALYRKPGRGPFTPAQANLVHVTLGEIPWLHEEGWPGEAVSEVPKLTRQQRLTLNLLLEGLNRNEIAQKMSLSPHTVGDYLKVVYQVFQVSTQAELLAKFGQGSGR